MTQGWGSLHNGELHNVWVFCSLRISKTKLKCVSLLGHVPCMVEISKAYTPALRSESLKEADGHG